MHASLAETPAGCYAGGVPHHTVPGVVVNHTPAAQRQYNGCPSLAILPDGDYVASHSLFGPAATNTDSFIYRSTDRGQSWRRIATVKGQIWSKLLLHHDALYLIGTDHCDRYGGRLNGRMVIRRSPDGGATWSDARDAASGLLSDEEGYHTGAVAIVEHGGQDLEGDGVCTHSRPQDLGGVRDVGTRRRRSPAAGQLDLQRAPLASLVAVPVDRGQHGGGSRR